MYLNVLEHIEEDNKEVLDAFEKLNPNGYLIILVPAHNKLYSKFDKDIHFLQTNPLKGLTAVDVETAIDMVKKQHA